MTSIAFALPGQVLSPASKHTPGPGTHIHDSNICASIAGLISTTTASNTPRANDTAPTPSTSTPASTITPSSTISILRNPPAALPTGPILPTVGATVLALITRLNPRQATCAILSIDNVPCVPHSSQSQETFQALIRSQDIRATQKDTVKPAEAFRVGDIVRAVVISLGDQNNYYLSTAENRLGVVRARSSESGEVMVPVSWVEMRDLTTGRGEGRKVARPDY